MWLPRRSAGPEAFGAECWAAYHPNHPPQPDDSESAAWPGQEELARRARRRSDRPLGHADEPREVGDVLTDAGCSRARMTADAGGLRPRGGAAR